MASPMMRLGPKWPRLSLIAAAAIMELSDLEGARRR